MSSLYRALVVVTVVGSLGTLAFIQVTASAADVKAKKAVMARRPVAARPVPPAKGPLPPVADFDNGTDSQFAEGLTLPTDHSKKRALDAAQELMEEENWDAAIDVLNDLLDHSKEDVFIEVRHKDGKGSDPISLRVKANELLGSMPAEGLEEYEVKCGGRAKSLLADAKKDNDRKLLAEVALKYQHTEAGAEAANLLGTYYLDRGEYVTADRCFAQLLGHHTADKLKPITLLKAALAFRRADDKGNAQKAWEMLSKKLSREELRIGDEAASLDQLQQILDRASPTTQLARNDVPYWGGNPSRSAQYTGGTPYLVTQWDQPTIRESQTKTWVEQGVQARERLGQPVVPAFFPVAATVQSDTGPMPLLIYRSYWGVHAVELRTGKLYWESVLPQGMDFLVKDSQKMGVLNQWWNFYQQLNSQSILFENSTLGMISTDGTSVYAVDDLAL
ncbi:MAG TPA: hypothetical protein VG013_03265, partial [Gemmataceae bacterium]|nr:hypothetical protein [Gemmataceae bacterium]